MPRSFQGPLGWENVPCRTRDDPGAVIIMHAGHHGADVIQKGHWVLCVTPFENLFERLEWRSEEFLILWFFYFIFYMSLEYTREERDSDWKNTWLPPKILSSIWHNIALSNTVSFMQSVSKIASQNENKRVCVCVWMCAHVRVRVYQLWERTSWRQRKGSFWAE